MRRLALAFCFVFFAISLCIAQGSTAPQAAIPAPEGNTAGPVTMRGMFPITPAKSIDSKKLKDGDALAFTTMAPVRLGSGMLVPTGAKVIGHVTVARGRSKGDANSSLGMVFDKIQASGSKEIEMKGVLLAIAPKLGGSNGPDTGVAGPGTMPGPGGETLSAPGTDSAVAGPNSGIHPLSGGGISHPIIISQSRGILGFRDMQMGKDGVLNSTNKEIKLDTGTQMLIQAEMTVPK